MTLTYLDKVYDARDADSTRVLYDKWAASYENETGAQGYVTPMRCAAALAEFTEDFDAPVLDYGCGTGLSGLALRHAGFTTLDGCDLSPEMLERARSKGIYRNLNKVEAGAKPLHDKGDYAVIAAIGVIGAGAAPISLFHDLMHTLAPGGKLVFSFNDHALEDPANEAGLCEWLDCGAARLLFREHGPHLPGIDLKSNVYVVERT